MIAICNFPTKEHNRRLRFGKVVPEGHRDESKASLGEISWISFVQKIIAGRFLEMRVFYVFSLLDDCRLQVHKSRFTLPSIEEAVV